MQASHAAILLGQWLPTTHPNIEPPYLVAIGVKSEDELMKVGNRLNHANIKNFPFIEPDRNDEMTAIVTEPVFGQDRRFFRRYRCLGATAPQEVA